MKKLFLAAAMMITSVAAFAQHEVGSLTVQPKVGMNVANITKQEDGDVRLGLVVGAEVEYQVTDLLSLSAGALYSMQGAKSSFTDYDRIYTSTIKLDYVNVPLLANVYVAPGLAVKAGVQPGFNVVHKVTSTVNGNTNTVDAEGVKTLDLSVPVGVSYEYKNFVLDARYNLGLTEIVKDSGSKHSVFQVTLGYKFGL